MSAADSLSSGRFPAPRNVVVVDTFPFLMIARMSCASSLVFPFILSYYHHHHHITSVLVLLIIVLLIISINTLIYILEFQYSLDIRHSTFLVV